MNVANAWLIYVVLFYVACCCVIGVDNTPNFIIILMDDQDLLLDSPSYMPNLQSKIVSKGMTFTNALVATPVCKNICVFFESRHTH